MAWGLSGERIEKILLHNFCNEILLFLSILLGIVVSALAFHAGGLGSIPRLGKSYIYLFLLLLLLPPPNLPQ
jgi:hypothetical protein